MLQRSRGYFAEARFSSPVTFETEDYTIDYYTKLGWKTGNHITLSETDFIFSVGTFIYRGLIGVPALKSFAEQPDSISELAHCRGQFAVILRKNGRTLLLRDSVGFQDVFCTDDGFCLTSSFLAAAEAISLRTTSPQEIYEYVFAGVSLGRGTPIAEVKRLDAFEHVILDRPPTIFRKTFDAWPPQNTASYDEQVQRNLDGLFEYTSELVHLFDSNIRVALSGGYDSRLLLALFRRSGVTPGLFVYGREDDQDVRIAKQIAELEHLNLWHLDKSRVPAVKLHEFPQTVRKKFVEEDGLAADGIFSGQAEQIARKQRNENGALHVNGGGGEIFRNFFYLLDRSIGPRQFVWCFYSQFDPAQCTALFDRKCFESSIAEKALAVLNSDSNRLSRRQIESLYPYFRCKSWFGRENSVNGRYGYSVLPFLDHRIIRGALEIPIRYKHFGNFEAALIRSADRLLARYSSNYGYGFDKEAPAWAVMRWLLTYIRPPRFRRDTFMLKNFLQPSVARDGPLSDRYLSEVIDTRFPYMSRYFKVNRVTSVQHFARICTLEYLFTLLSAEGQARDQV